MPRKTESTAMEKATEFDALTEEEEKIIDAAVVFINTEAIGAANAMGRALINIGEYLLATFFDGDPKQALSRGGRKGLSLRKLAQRENLELSHTSLANAVKIAIQEKTLGAAIADPKTLSEQHRVYLLSVPSDKKKVQYAKRVEKEEMSALSLRKLLIKDEFIQPRGRPPLGQQKAALPEASFSFDDLFAPFETFSLDKIPFDDLSTDDAKSALEAALKAQESLIPLIERLKERAGAAGENSRS